MRPQFSGAQQLHRLSTLTATSDHQLRGQCVENRRIVSPPERFGVLRQAVREVRRALLSSKTGRGQALRVQNVCRCVNPAVPE